MEQNPIKICNVYVVDFPSMVYRQLEKGKWIFPKKTVDPLKKSNCRSKIEAPMKPHRISCGAC